METIKPKKQFLKKIRFLPEVILGIHVRAGRDLGGAIGAARFYLRDLPISIDDDDALPSRSSWFPTFLRTHGQDVGTLVSTWHRLPARGGL